MQQGYHRASPAFTAIDRGYDAWFGNSRGNYYSMKHESLDPVKDENKFWDFSFPEIAKYDIPAVISYIKDVTGSSKVSYVGFSMGTTQMFYGLAKPELQKFYSESLNLFVALAPCTKVTHASVDNI